MKCERSKKLLIKLKTRKAFNIKLNKLIKTMSIINEYQIKTF